MLPGLATRTGTLAYAKRHPGLSYHSMGKSGLFSSEAGFGGYRIHDQVPKHYGALAKALSSGINLIDTSANYTDGGSERLIGKVLQDLVDKGEILREEIIVVSKGGYLQGENYQLSQKRKTAGIPFRELVEYDDGLEHCIHPEFLAEQIGRSLERLGIETIDCYLLHNPEYYLKWAEEHNVPIREAKTEYLRRIREAFIYLEEEVAKGRIGRYGISSNTFVLPRGEYTFTSLAKILDLAEIISQHHHFQVIELPCNLFETGAVTESNQPDGETILELAAKKELTVLINRPLNAIQDNQLIRLAEKAYEGEAAQESVDFYKRVSSIDPAWHNASSLSHLALRALRSTNGVTAVLVGMRQAAYVEDILEELHEPCVKENRRASWGKIK